MDDIKDDGTEQDPSSRASIDETADASQQDVEMLMPDPAQHIPLSQWKKWVIAGIILAIVGLAIGLGIGLTNSKAKTAASSVPFQEKEDLLQADQHFIEYSCEQDSDCVVMDVGSCCGYYPECLHKSSTPDPSNACNDGGSSICGFPSIETCVCDTEQLGGKCQASQE
jgi:hypothetical protein